MVALRLNPPVDRAFHRTGSVKIAAGEVPNLRFSPGQDFLRRTLDAGASCVRQGGGNLEQSERNHGRFHFTASRYAFVRWQRRHVTADGSRVPDDPYSRRSPQATTVDKEALSSARSKWTVFISICRVVGNMFVVSIESSTMQRLAASREMIQKIVTTSCHLASNDCVSYTPSIHSGFTKSRKLPTDHKK